MAISLNKAITRNSDNTITTTTNYNELNVKASALVEDLVDKVETELASAETQINSQIGALQSAEAYASQAQSSASSASAIVLGESTGRANIKPVLNLDFANQKRLDSRVDFTRTSTATYYDGKKQVKAEENLLKYSEDFSNEIWTKYGSIAFDYNAITAPDGTLTATKVTSTDKTGAAFQILGYNADINYVRTIYAKVQTGTAVVSLNAHSSNGTVTLTDQWQRFELKATSTNYINYFYLVDFRHAGCTATEVHIWHPQLEQRDFATAYTPTTNKPITNYIPVLSTAQANEPRFDYDLETKECKGLLIEEQRTNLFANSSDISTNFLKSQCFYQNNVAIAPDGTLSADKLVLNDGSTSGWSTKSTTVGTGNTVTVSIFAKANGLNNLHFFGSGNATGSIGGKFNLADGTFTNSNGLCSMEYYGNGWYRCSTVYTENGTAETINAYIGIPTVSGVVGNGYDGILLWGLQVEQGSFATSYIPTNGSQVTRTADNCSISGENFSSFYNPSEGTFYAECKFHNANDNGIIISNGYNYPAFIASNLNTSYFHFYNGYTGTFSDTVNKEDFNIIASSYTIDTIRTAREDSVDLKSQVDNNKIRNTSRLYFGVNANTHIKKISYYDKALSDTELQLMTEV